MTGTLDRARLRAGLSHSELWFRYFELGGMSTAFELEAYLCEALTLTHHDAALVTRVLDQCSATRDDRSVPNTEDDNDGGRRD